MNASIVNRVATMVEELSLLRTQISSETAKDEESKQLIIESHTFVSTAIHNLIRAKICLESNEWISGKTPTETQSDGSFKPVIWTL
jgi:trehalose/maltose hydrolase-like predicted phosphorylase